MLLKSFNRVIIEKHLLIKCWEKCFNLIDGQEKLDISLNDIKVINTINSVHTLIIKSLIIKLNHGPIIRA